MSTKIALVTGGSSGIGEATALKLQGLGYTTYAAAQRVQRMQHLTESGIRPLEMDVTNEASMLSAFNRPCQSPDLLCQGCPGAFSNRECGHVMNPSPEGRRACPYPSQGETIGCMTGSPLRIGVPS